MSDNMSGTETTSPQEGIDAAVAEDALGRLPTLGPIAWLYGRTPDRRFFFLGDLDWAVMPPVILDQCRLFMKGKLPFAFMTWAFVAEDVHQRLLAGVGKLAPHEWKGGPNLWLVDVVTPFGGLQELLTELQRVKFPGQTLRYLYPDPVTRKVEVREFAGAPSTSAVSSPAASEAPPVH